MLEDIQKFNQWLEVNGYAVNSRRDYTQRVKDFLGFFQDNLSQEKVELYFLEIKNKYKNKTVNCYRDAIGAFLKFKSLEIKIPKRFKEERTIPDTITFEEFEKEIVVWIDYAFFDNPYKPLALLDLMLKSGLRKSEICALKRADIDLEKKMGKVFRQKCNDWHIFLFDEVTCRRLRSYFMCEREKTNAFNLGRGGINHVFFKLRKYFTKKRLTPHMFRHSLATKLLEEGVNLRYIQKILGHRNISSTERYTKVNMENLQEVYLLAIEKRKK